MARKWCFTFALMSETGSISSVSRPFVCTLWKELLMSELGSPLIAGRYTFSTADAKCLRNIGSANASFNSVSHLTLLSFEAVLSIIYFFYHQCLVSYPRRDSSTQGHEDLFLFFPKSHIVSALNLGLRPIWS